jgi:hypothetical protein
MQKFILTPIVAALLVAILNVGAADAQAARTWVSGVGDDVNPCSRTAPCKTFAGAISKTAAGGMINCMDSGGFGAVTINKSITIDCTGTIAGILAAGTNGINITATSGLVILRNLEIAAPGTQTGVIGIRANAGASVRVEKCRISSFRSGGATGISYTAPAGTVGQLYITDTVVSESGTDDSNGGIVITAVGTGSVRAIIDRVQLHNNSTGLLVNGTGSTGGIWVTVRQSVSAGNSRSGLLGIMPAAGSTLIDLLVDSSAFSNNGTNGIQANGANANIFVGGSVVAGNDVGFSSVNGGGLFSYKTNMVHQNRTSNGTPLPASNILPLQ